MIDDVRGVALWRLVLRTLRVEAAKGILLEPRPALFAQLRKMRPVILAQQFPVGWPADLIANAVQVEAHAANVQRRKPVPSQHDRFHVEHRAGVTDGLDAELVELSKAPRLGTVVSEIRPVVEEANGLRLPVAATAEIPPADGG